VLGEVGGRTYAFIGLERVGGVMVYDVTDPVVPTFVQYINTRDFTADVESASAGDIGPEGLLFIKAVDSPNGKPLLVVANEVSGTTTTFAIEPGDLAEPAGRLYLFDAKTDKVIGELTEGARIVLPGLANRSLAVKAVFTDGAVQSVRFELNGATTAIESYEPYAMFGDNGNDLFGRWFGSGQQTVVATAFARDGAKGDELAKLAVNFTLAEPKIAIDEVRLFDGVNDTDQGLLVNGGTVNLADVPRPTVFVKTEPGIVGSVKFTLDGRVVNIENVMPYTMFRNDDFDFYGGRLTEGRRTLTITPFSGHNATGIAGEAMTIVFDVVDLADNVFAEALID
jgi:hypothetical protein